MVLPKRKMLLIPELNPHSFVLFFERGESGTSWSIRDYSTASQVRVYGPAQFEWRADDVHQRARHSLNAPTRSTTDLSFWHEHTIRCNRQFLRVTKLPVNIESNALRIAAGPADQLEPSTATRPFPILNFPQLRSHPKSKKTADMKRILYSKNSEDWVTWNWFQTIFRECPGHWWPTLVGFARRRNSHLTSLLNHQSVPDTKFWSAVRPPSEYEAQRRASMLDSTNNQWTSRAKDTRPVEGRSEIDVIFNHADFVVFLEAKLGSDISMSTSYDPQRNQIVRNIDCLIASAGNRVPIFWMIVKDQKPDRAYVQLMSSYKADSSLLCKALPHRNESTLSEIAKNLTFVMWSDFEEVFSKHGVDPEATAVNLELVRRVLNQQTLDS